MASSKTTGLRQRHAALTTSRKAFVPILDRVDLPHETTAPFSPESTCPTPPASSPWQGCDQLDSRPISKPAPLALSRRSHEIAQPRTPKNRGTKCMAEPQTPRSRMNAERQSAFTPFHDIKQDIDDLIGELPGNTEQFAQSDGDIVIQRSANHNGKSLSLFLYSPSKKRAAQEYIDAEDEEEFGGHELIILPYADLPIIPPGQSESHVHHSLIRRAGRILKRTIMLFIPRTKKTGASASSRDGTLAGCGELELISEQAQVNEMKANHEFRTNKRTSFAVLAESRIRLPISVSRNISLPIITAKTPVSERRLSRITSTIRKPLPDQQPRLRHLRVRKVNVTHLPLRIQSRHASVYDMSACPALDGAPIAIKAAASLCVMALAAGADFLVEDCRTQKRRVAWTESRRFMLSHSQHLRLRSGRRRWLRDSGTDTMRI